MAARGALATNRRQETPLLIDALTSLTNWTWERGNANAWTSSGAAPSTVMSKPGPEGTGWLPINTSTGFYAATPNRTGGRSKRTLAAPIDLSGHTSIGVSYVMNSTWAWPASSNVRLYLIALELGSDGDGSFTNSILVNFTINSSTCVNGAINTGIFRLTGDFTATGSFNRSSVRDIRISIYGAEGNGPGGTAGSSAPTVYFQGLYAGLRTTPIVCIGIDGGFLDTYQITTSLLEAKGWRAIHHVLPATVEGVSASFCHKTELDDLYARGFDIGLRNGYLGTSPNVVGNNTAVAADILKGVQWCESNGYTRAGHVNSLLSGLVNSSDTVKCFDAYYDAGVRVVKTTTTGINSISNGLRSCSDYDASGKNTRGMLLHIQQLDSATNTPASVLPAQIAKLTKYGGVLCLRMHDVKASGATGENINQADFEDLLSRLRVYEQQGLINVERMSDVFAADGSVKTTSRGRAY